MEEYIMLTEAEKWNSLKTFCSAQSFSSRVFVKGFQGENGCDYFWTSELLLSQIAGKSAQNPPSSSTVSNAQNRANGVIHSSDWTDRMSGI